MESPSLTLLNYRLMRQEAQRLRPAVENINTDKKCGDLINCAGNLIGGLFTGGKVQDEQALMAKNSFLAKIYRAEADGIVTENYLQAWDLSSVKGRRVSSVIVRRMILKPDFSQFYAIYQMTTDSGISRFIGGRSCGTTRRVRCS